jgi:hypothetical protein
VPYRSAYMGDINTRISTVFFSGIKLIKIEDILGTAQILHGRTNGVRTMWIDVAEMVRVVVLIVFETSFD